MLYLLTYIDYMPCEKKLFKYLKKHLKDCKGLLEPQIQVYKTWRALIEEVLGLVEKHQAWEGARERG